MTVEERASRGDMCPFREAGSPPTVVLGYRVKLRKEEPHYLKRRSVAGDRVFWLASVHLAKPPRNCLHHDRFHFAYELLDLSEREVVRVRPDFQVDGRQPFRESLQVGLWGSKTGHRGLTCGFACGSSREAGSIAGL